MRDIPEGTEPLTVRQVVAMQNIVFGGIGEALCLIRRTGNLGGRAQAAVEISMQLAQETMTKALEGFDVAEPTTPPEPETR